MARHPWFQQLDSMDCGPTCLRMIASHYGRRMSAAAMRQRVEFGRLGVSLGALADLGEAIGFRSLVMRVPVELVLGGEVPLPCVAFWDERHFVVIYSVGRRGRVTVGDPATGVSTISADEFRAHFTSGERADSGMVLMLEPTPELTSPRAQADEPPSGIRYLWGYIRPHRRYMTQIVVGLLVGAAMSLVMPFLTQALIDHGVALRDLGFVQMVLLAQLAIFAGRLTIDFLRSWLVLHVGARMNLALVSDFLSHLMRLPMPFFDARSAGDVLQRVDDHRRIEALLSSTLLTVLIAMVTLAVYAIVLGLYSTSLLGVFAAGSVLAVIWPLSFMRRRRVLDQRAFGERAAGQNALVEIVAGMGEIKLANSELHHRWRWERVQARLVRVIEQQLQLGQVQQAARSASTS